MGLIIALILTLIIEGGIVAIQSCNRKWVLYVCLINVVTNPLINIIVYICRGYLAPERLQILIYVLEVVVVFVEGWLIYKLRATKSFSVKPLSLPRSLLYALILNTISYCLGLFLL